MNARAADLSRFARIVAEQSVGAANDLGLGAVGVCVLVFDFSPGDSVGWATNARREDMARLLREHADRVEHGADGEAPP
jgi:hypothetical protein